MKAQKIAIIGLGYVGLPLAVEFGKKREVIGFDINQERITQLKDGNDSTLETRFKSSRMQLNLVTQLILMISKTVNSILLLFRRLLIKIKCLI